MEAELIRRLETAHAALSLTAVQQLALLIMRDDLRAQLDRYVAAHRQQVVAAVDNWWDKYRVTARAIEIERDAAAARLASYLRDLGYSS